MKAFAAIFLTLLLCGGKCEANVLQFLYIEAAEGNSSGGHVALRIADKIYHYQYDEGYIRLFRQTADGFLNDYRFKQNRSVHVADIRVSGDTFERIEDYFKVRFQQHKQHRLTVKTSRQDLALIQTLLALKRGEGVNGTEIDGQLPRLSGAGLFYRDQTIKPSEGNQKECDTAGIAQATMPELQSKLRSRYGEDFLKRKINGLHDKINRLTPVLTEFDNPGEYGFAERYSDLTTGLLALEAIQHQLPLMDDACFQLHHTGVALNPAKLNLLNRYRETLVQSVQALADSKRPDWGYALFVSLARLLVVERTLQTQRWTFLDDTGGSTTEISSEDLALYGNAINKLRRDDENSLVKKMNAFASAGSIDLAYAALEIFANRYRQWQLSDRSRAFRYRGEQSLPQKDIPVSPYLSTDLTKAQLEETARQLDSANKTLVAWDNEQHGYHLLTKNCVTALLAALDAAVSGQAQEQLGGAIDPKLNAIPFQAYEAVISSYRVTSSKKLPGYRELALTKLYKDEADALVYARESNVLTSSLYRHHDGDAWFVFFTDDEILPRPLFGAVNVLAAASQSAVGLFIWPFDKGRQLKTGVKGILASLPEFAFFNIRKGSYPYPVERLN